MYSKPVRIGGNRADRNDLHSRPRESGSSLRASVFEPGRSDHPPERRRRRRARFCSGAPKPQRNCPPASISRERATADGRAGAGSQAPRFASPGRQAPTRGRTWLAAIRKATAPRAAPRSFSGSFEKISNTGSSPIERSRFGHSNWSRRSCATRLPESESPSRSGTWRPGSGLAGSRRNTVSFILSATIGSTSSRRGTTTESRREQRFYAGVRSA